MESAPTGPSVRDVASALEGWAPPGSAQSYDNVGLQVGDPGQAVVAGLIALDLTPVVIEEAAQLGANLVVTHHPLLFRPLKSISPQTWVGGLALRLAQRGIALYSIHTNLDAAPGGVSFALAETLGLADVRFLDRFESSLLKLITFVPPDHADRLRAALADAGAGRIGAYDACAFVSEGTGHFRPGIDARPFIGTPGGPVEAVREMRLEVEVSRWDVDRVVAALRDAHPYETAAYDLVPVGQPHTRAGMGAIGRLPEAVPLRSFLQTAAARLGADGLRYVGDPDRGVQTVAVCGGAGSDLIPKAQRAGADVFVTADVTYHRFFDVLDSGGNPRMALVDAGHYETEAMTEGLLERWLAGRFPATPWHRTRHRTGPVRTFVPG